MTTNNLEWRKAKLKCSYVTSPHHNITRRVAHRGEIVLATTASDLPTGWCHIKPADNLRIWSVDTQAHSFGVSVREEDLEFLD